MPFACNVVHEALAGSRKVFPVRKQRRASVLRSFGVIPIMSLFAGVAAAQPAPNARPAGGSVTGGTASIAQTTTETDISQASSSAVVQWSSFDIGRNTTVNAIQPGSASAILNSVIGPDPSAIAGRLTANGQLYLTNQKGIVFDQGSQIATGNGFVASTVFISTTNFMSGNRDLTGAPPPGSSVTNEGTITVGQTIAGASALIADSVTNAGVITIQQGTMSVGGTATAPRTFDNRGYIEVGASGALDIAGDLTEQGNLVFDVAGAAAGSYGQLVGATDATLDGTLSVSFVDLGSGPFMPVAGESFDLVEGSNLVGDFAGFELPVLAAGLSWQHGVVDLGGGQESYRLEVVGATSVPEPSSWVVLIVGAAAIGIPACRSASRRSCLHSQAAPAVT